jgi:hypothetical protein
MTLLFFRQHGNCFPGIGGVAWTRSSAMQAALTIMGAAGAAKL